MQGEKTGVPGARCGAQDTMQGALAASFGAGAPPQELHGESHEVPAMRALTTRRPEEREAQQR